MKSSMQTHIFRGTFSKELGPHLFALIQHFLDASNQWNDDLWIYHTTNARFELIQAIKATTPHCAIRNPSTSLLKVLRTQHTVYINRYISFFNDLPLKIGFMTNSIPGHSMTITTPTSTILSYWDYAPVIQKNLWNPLFPKKIAPQVVCHSIRFTR